MSEWVPYKDGDEIPSAYAYWIVTPDRAVALGEKIYLKGNQFGFGVESWGRIHGVTHYIAIQKPEAP